MPVDRDRFINKGVAATYTQSLTDALDLKSVGAYREGKGRQFIDFDELNANLFQVPAQYSDDQTSGEVQLTYTSDLVTGVAGVYYFTGTADGAFDASLGSGAVALTSLTTGSVDTDSLAVYLDTTWSLDRALELERRRALERGRQGSDGVRRPVSWLLAPNQTLFDPNNVPAGFTLFALQSNYTQRPQLLECIAPSGHGFQFQRRPDGVFQLCRRIQERWLRHARQCRGQSGDSQRL